MTITMPILCSVQNAKYAFLARDDSLVENMQRDALHPIDQFSAFVTPKDKGLNDEKIASAFFVTAQVVNQCLKRASVAPALLGLYAEDKMTLKQLMAFTVKSDHEREIQVWEAIPSSWNKEPYQIRRMLAEPSGRVSDSGAVFVGIEAYETAAGWKTLPCSIVWSARSFRLKRKRLRPKVGNGLRSRSTCLWLQPRFAAAEGRPGTDGG